MHHFSTSRWLTPEWNRWTKVIPNIRFEYVLQNGGTFIMGNTVTMASLKVGHAVTKWLGLNERGHGVIIVRTWHSEIKQEPLSNRFVTSQDEHLCKLIIDCKGETREETKAATTRSQIMTSTTIIYWVCFPWPWCCNVIPCDIHNARCWWNNFSRLKNKKAALWQKPSYPYLGWRGNRSCVELKKTLI